MAEEGTESEGTHDTGSGHTHSEHVTRAELEKHISELRAERVKLKEELDELHSRDTKEREDIRQEVSAISAYIAELEEAEKKRDEVKGSKSTMVLPPADIPPQQPNPQPPPVTGTSSEPRRRLRLW